MDANFVSPVWQGGGQAAGGIPQELVTADEEDGGVMRSHSSFTFDTPPPATNPPPTIEEVSRRKFRFFDNLYRIINPVVKSHSCSEYGSLWKGQGHIQGCGNKASRCLNNQAGNCVYCMQSAISGYGG